MSGHFYRSQRSLTRAVLEREVMHQLHFANSQEAFAMACQRYEALRYGDPMPLKFSMDVDFRDIVQSVAGS